MTQGANYGTSGLDRKTRPPQSVQQQTEAQHQGDPWGGFEDRPDPVKIDLGEGEVFTGVLTSIERRMVGNPPKPAVRYSFIEMESSKAYFMIGTYQIDSKLRPSDVGHLVMIRFEGVDTSVGRNGNNMKRFGVRVSKRSAPGWTHDGSPITDDDLPPEAFTN